MLCNGNEQNGKTWCEVTQWPIGGVVVGSVCFPRQVIFGGVSNDEPCVFSIHLLSNANEFLCELETEATQMDVTKH